MGYMGYSHQSCKSCNPTPTHSCLRTWEVYKKKLERNAPFRLSVGGQVRLYTFVLWLMFFLFKRIIMNWYCWWTKSCTIVYLIKTWFSDTSSGAGFCPSTVVLECTGQILFWGSLIFWAIHIQQDGSKWKRNQVAFKLPHWGQYEDASGCKKFKGLPTLKNSQWDS